MISSCTSSVFKVPRSKSSSAIPHCLVPYVMGNLPSQFPIIKQVSCLNLSTAAVCKLTMTSFFSRRKYLVFIEHVHVAQGTVRGLLFLILFFFLIFFWSNHMTPSFLSSLMMHAAQNFSSAPRGQQTLALTKGFFFHSFWKHEHDDGSRTASVTGSKIVGEIDIVLLKPLIFIPHPHIRPQSYHLIKAQWHTRFHREWLLESSDVASCCSCCDHDRRDIKLEAHEHGCVDARTERVRSVAEWLPMIGLDLRA